MAVLKRGLWRNGASNLRVPMRAERDASKHKSRVSRANKTFLRTQVENAVGCHLFMKLRRLCCPPALEGSSRALGGRHEEGRGWNMSKGVHTW
jgi:hypothetical protein